MFWLVKLVLRLSRTGTIRNTRYSTRVSAATALRPVSSLVRRLRSSFISPACLGCRGGAAMASPRQARLLTVVPASRGRGGCCPVLVELLHLSKHVRRPDN